MRTEPLKLLVAKPGLDGHDKGAKIVALALKDAGMNVIYTGLHRRLEQIVDTARDENVDAVGLSIMSGAHLQITRSLLGMMKTAGMGTVKVFVGGVIPAKDIAPLQAMGVEGVFPGGTPLDVITTQIREAFLD